MLGERPIQPVLLATDLGAVKAFYHDLLGLEVLSEDERHIVFRCGGGTQLALTKSTTGTADTQTQATWLVDDVRAEVAWLRSRGVKVEEVDLPGCRPTTASPTSGSRGRRGSSIRPGTRWASPR